MFYAALMGPSACMSSKILLDPRVVITLLLAANERVTVFVSRRENIKRTLFLIETALS